MDDMTCYENLIIESVNQLNNGKAYEKFGPETAKINDWLDFRNINGTLSHCGPISGNLLTPGGAADGPGVVLTTMAALFPHCRLFCSCQP